MAALVVWASGLLEVIPNKDVTPDGGPIILLEGTAGRLTSAKVAHGEHHEDLGAFYVPGTRDAETEAERMPLVGAFAKKLRTARLKQKGRRHLLAAQGAE